MRARIASTRIPVGQANGSYDILVPQGLGIPKGFLVYAMTNSARPNVTDTTTSFPCLSIGFGGSNIAGSGLTNVCSYIVQQRGSDPSESRAGFANTVSVFTTNIAGTVRRQWQMTGFGENIIFGNYQATGTQTEPLDLVFTVFGGDDFRCAVGQTAIATSGTSTNVGMGFQPDAMLHSTLRPGTTTDGFISFAASNRVPAIGNSTVTAQSNFSYAIRRGVDPTETISRLEQTASTNLVSTATVRINHFTASGFAVTQSSVNAHSIIFLAMKAGYGTATQGALTARLYSATAGPTANITLPTSPANFFQCCIIGARSNGPTFDTTSTTNENWSLFTAAGIAGTGATSRSERPQLISAGIGTFTSSTSSTTLTGVGTSFLQQLGAPDRIFDSDDQFVGIVSSITSNTSLLLLQNAAITATGSNFRFAKSQQFSFLYGSVDNTNSGINAYSRVDDSAMCGRDSTGVEVRNVINFSNSAGISKGFQYRRWGSTEADRGWYLAIRDDDYHFRIPGSIS
jgi:hypothetical protein